VARDERLDALQGEIERKAFRLIALRQPMAVDLRHAVAALKISMSLERCGDMAKNIGKRALILTDAEPMTALTRSIERMGRLVQGRLKDVLDAYTAPTWNAPSACGAATRKSTSTTTPSSANC
jgi:phosphate transport system protein